MWAQAAGSHSGSTFIKAQVLGVWSERSLYEASFTLSCGDGDGSTQVTRAGVSVLAWDWSCDHSGSLASYKCKAGLTFAFMGRSTRMGKRGTWELQHGSRASVNVWWRDGGRHRGFWGERHENREGGERERDREMGKRMGKWCLC